MSEHVKKFETLGFGLFVHYGLYSRIGRGEWYIHLNNYAKSRNYENVMTKFKVKRSWARELVAVAKKAGCRYITITARHHDGFSLFDTNGLSEFDAPHSLAGRDLLSEFVSECRNADIVPFFFFSMLDWHDRRYSSDFPLYTEYLVKSVELLCKNYGKIGGFWLDGMWDKPYEAWPEERIYSTIKRLQPDAIIINNSGLSERRGVIHRELDCALLECGLSGGVSGGRDNANRSYAKEISQTLNDHWGYVKDDCNYKAPRELIETLIYCRKNNSNFALNTGLLGDGSVNDMDRCILEEIGKWVRRHGDFIYGVHSSDIKADGAYIVEDGKYIYAVIKNVGASGGRDLGSSDEARTVRVDAEIKSAVWLDNGKSIRVKNNSFEAEPFEYGESYGVRIARLTV